VYSLNKQSRFVLDKTDRDGFTGIQVIQKNSMPIYLAALTNAQLNQHLEARGSRTSGSRHQREDRLQRFLDFEDQKERRAQYVQQMRQQKEEMDGQQDQDQDQDVCSDTCECTQAQAQTEEERVARTLLDLRDDAERSQYYINHIIPRVKVLEDENHRLNQAFIDLDESYEVVVGENLRLNQRIDNLEMRLSHVENRSDSPPPLMNFPESNPMWKLEDFHQY